MSLLVKSRLAQGPKLGRTQQPFAARYRYMINHLIIIIPIVIAFGHDSAVVSFVRFLGSIYRWTLRPFFPCNFGVFLCAKNCVPSLIYDRMNHQVMWWKIISKLNYRIIYYTLIFIYQDCNQNDHPKRSIYLKTTISIFVDHSQ